MIFLIEIIIYVVLENSELILVPHNTIIMLYILIFICNKIIIIVFLGSL